MRRSLVLAVAMVVSFLAGTLVPTARTQKAESPQARKLAKYIEVDFMKVQPGKDAEYVQLEKEMWKPIHQERVKAGQLNSWLLYGQRIPFGTDEKYDYVTINAFDQFSQIENPFAEFTQYLQKTHPGTKAADFEDRTSKARRLVRSEIWELVDHTD